MVVGIGGPSNAGKSDLAKKILRELNHLSGIVLCLDDYVYPESHLSRIRGRIDWEHPDTIRFDQLIADLRNASQQYDIVIVEGFLLYSDPSILNEIDKMIFIEITEKTFRQRKVQDLRWGEEPSWYIDHIWSRYLAYGRPPEGLEMLFLEGEQEWPLKRILAFINN